MKISHDSRVAAAEVIFEENKLPQRVPSHYESHVLQMNQIQAKLPLEGA